MAEEPKPAAEAEEQSPPLADAEEEFEQAFDTAAEAAAGDAEASPEAKEAAPAPAQPEPKAEEPKSEAPPKAAAAPKEPPAAPSETVLQAPSEKQKRNRMLGRIGVERKALSKLEKDFRGAHGPLPSDRTPEELKEAQKAQEADKRVTEELPAVSAALDTRIAALKATIEEEAAEAQTANKAELQRVSHEAALTAAHGDWRLYQSGAGTEERALLEEWIQIQPYKEGVKLARILQEGTPAEVNGMLSGFKQDVAKLLDANQEPKSGRQPSSKTLAAAHAAEAVPAGAGSTPRGSTLPHEDDFEGMFDRLTAS